MHPQVLHPPAPEVPTAAAARLGRRVREPVFAAAFSASRTTSSTAGVLNTTGLECNALVRSMIDGK